MSDKSKEEIRKQFQGYSCQSLVEEIGRRAESQACGLRKFSDDELTRELLYFALEGYYRE